MPSPIFGSPFRFDARTERRGENRLLQSSFAVFGENAVENLQSLVQGHQRPEINHPIRSLVELVPAVKQFVDQFKIYTEQVETTAKEGLILHFFRVNFFRKPFESYLTPIRPLLRNKNLWRPNANSWRIGSKLCRQNLIREPK